MARKKGYDKLFAGENDDCTHHTPPLPNDQLFRLPKGFHSPPPGYIDNANRYLWKYEQQSPPPIIYFENRDTPGHKYRELKCDGIASTSNDPHRENMLNEIKKRSKSSSFKHDSPYSNLPYISPPNSPIGGRNIAPLGQDEFDYHQTFNRDCRGTPLIFCLTKNTFRSFFAYLRGQSPLRIMAVFFVFVGSLGLLIEYSRMYPNMRKTQILRHIIEKGLSLEEALMTSGSAQYNALQWISEEDPMQLNSFDEDIYERYSLAVLYFSTTPINDGDRDWDPHPTWLSGKTVHYWDGVVTNKEKTSITGLNLTSLQGHLPGMELSALSELQWIHFGYGNQIKGTLPSEIGKLTDLMILSLENNMLTGSIPSQITQLTSLELLGLQNNLFEGAIPSDMGDLSSLVVASLDNNRLSGEIPSSFGKLEGTLVDLRLNNNLIQGEIPSELGSLSRLHKLYLDSNNIEGQIPPEICSLMRRNEIDFRIDCNELNCTSTCCVRCLG